MSDAQDRAEQLDNEVFGENPRKDELPGLNQYVDIGPMSSEDPAVLMGDADTRDEIHTREWRETPDFGVVGQETVAPPAMSLLHADGFEADGTDDGKMLGEIVRPADGAVGPEDAALHLEADNS